MDGITLFSGGGGSDIGVTRAGVNIVQAFESSEEVCGVYADNFGPHVTCARVEDCNFKPYASISFAWASPVCKSYSLAKAGREELEIDITSGATKRPARAWLEQGRVVAISPRCLARFQAFPDSYRLPTKTKLACLIIGNAVCPPIAEAATRSVIEC